MRGRRRGVEEEGERREKGERRWGEGGGGMDRRGEGGQGVEDGIVRLGKRKISLSFQFGYCWSY